MSYDADAYTQEYQNSGSHSKKKSRRQSAPTSSAAQPPPLKSAMKKTTANAMATPMVNSLEFPGYGAPQYGGNNISAPSGYPLSRQRTNSLSRSHQDHQRRRTLSNAYSQQDHTKEPEFTPLHMFMSFNGYNELHVENVSELGLSEMRQQIWSLWAEGIESQPVSEQGTIVKFRGHPWDMSGPNALMALQLIKSLFTLCYERGYVFQTAVNIGQSTPRLVFQVSATDRACQFFMAYFTSSGRRLTLVNPPSNVDVSIGAYLKTALPRKISTEHVEQSNLTIIEVKRKVGQSAPEVEYSLFLCHVLKAMDHLNCQLITSIPLSKKQSLGMRGSQEVMVFKAAN